MTMLTRLGNSSRRAHPWLVYVYVYTRTHTQGGYTHTDRLSTQACWRQDKSCKKPPKRVKKIKIGLSALRHKGKADVEPPSQQWPIETISVLALALFCMRIMFWDFFVFTLSLRIICATLVVCLIMNRIL